MELFYMLFAVAAVVFAHEAGHYYMAWCFGAKPKADIHWWGVSVGGDRFLLLRVWQLAMVNFYGVVTGFVALACLFPMTGIVYCSYALFCCADLASLVTLQRFSMKEILFDACAKEYRQNRRAYLKIRKAEGMRALQKGSHL